jgi:hypothetical protein
MPIITHDPKTHITIEFEASEDIPKEIYSDDGCAVKHPSYTYFLLGVECLPIVLELHHI